MSVRTRLLVLAAALALPFLAAEAASARADAVLDALITARARTGSVGSTMA